MDEKQDLQTLYQSCLEGYHRVDDFRAKLLGFLPLGSIAVLGALYYPPRWCKFETVDNRKTN